MLLEGGIDYTRQREGGMTAVMDAAQNGHETVVGTIVNYGLDHIKQEDKSLMDISKGVKHDLGNVTIIDRPFDIDQCDDEGRTALMHAARSGMDHAMLPLLQHGANVGRKDKNGQTPLNMSASKEVAQRLLAAAQRANPDPKTQPGIDQVPGHLRNQLGLETNKDKATKRAEAHGHTLHGMPEGEALKVATEAVRKLQAENDAMRQLKEDMAKSGSALSKADIAKAKEAANEKTNNGDMDWSKIGKEMDGLRVSMRKYSGGGWQTDVGDGEPMEEEEASKFIQTEFKKGVDRKDRNKRAEREMNRMFRSAHDLLDGIGCRGGR